MNADETAKLYAELKELGVKIDHLTELFNHAAYGGGFTRCATQANRMDHLEEQVALCHDRVSGVKKWLVAGVVSVASMLANVVWNLVHSSLKNQ